MPRRPVLLCSLAVALVAMATACVDQGPRSKPVTARLVVDTTFFVIGVDEARDVRLECLDRNGRVLPDAPMAWTSYGAEFSQFRAGRVTLDASGARARVRGISEGPVTLFGACMDRQTLRELEVTRQLFDTFGVEIVAQAGIWVTAPSDTTWAIDATSDTLRLRAPSDDDSTSGVTQLLTLRTTLGAQQALEPGAFAWSSDDSSVARIARDGLVRAVRSGVTQVRVARGTRTQTLPVRVDSTAPTDAWDIALVNAHWTQGAQDESQRIPLVRNGRAAAVNVLAHATPNAPASFVALQVWNTSGQIIWTARTPLTPARDSAPSFAAPSAQFLVPREVVRDAARWRVMRDSSLAGEALSDANASNDMWPRSGTMPLSSTTASTLYLRLVPIRLAGNGNYTTPIAPEHRLFYDSIPRIRLPIGDVVVAIEPPLTIQSRMRTEAELDANPSADAELWSEALEKVDSRRLASGVRRSEYWIGVLPKPSADADLRWGGIAYLPSSARDAGPMTRSMLVRGHDWYQSPISAGSTVSHELGHNFGLRHAPCGGAGGPDPAYPVPGGGVGSWVHWVSRWANGGATSATTIEPNVGDFMGYCSSNFVGVYHTRVILAWRAMADEPFAMAPAVTRVLAVRGSLTERGIVLRTPELMDAEPVSVASGSVLVEAIASDGRVLLRGWARTGQLSEGTAVPFVAHLPIGSLREGDIARVRVTQGTRRAEAPQPTRD